MRQVARALLPSGEFQMGLRAGGMRCGDGVVRRSMCRTRAVAASWKSWVLVRGSCRYNPKDLNAAKPMWGRACRLLLPSRGAHELRSDYSDPAHEAQESQRRRGSRPRAVYTLGLWPT